MLLRHQCAGRRRDLVVEVHDPDATVADLAAALDPHRPPGPLEVDGRWVPAATSLDRAFIPDGAVVTSPSPPEETEPLTQGTRPGPTSTVVVTGGFDSGRRIDLGPGEHLLGRAPGVLPDVGTPDPVPSPETSRIPIADPTVSSDHLHLHIDPTGHVAITDLASTNGTRVDGVALRPRVTARWEPGATVVCGAAQLELVPATRADSPPAPPAAVPGGGRTRPLHRRPRTGQAPEVREIEIPPDPEPPPPVTPIGLIAVAGSVAVGAVMVVVLGSLTYAIFALLGPVLLVANALDSKRRRRRTTRLAGRRRRVQLRQLAEDLQSAAEKARTARSQRFPGPIDAVARARLQPDRLWQRRGDHQDAYCVRIATGEVPWDPPFSAARETWEPDVVEVVAEAGLGSTAVGLQLRAGTLIAVAGPVAAARATVRSILVQAVVDHGPADLQVAVLAAPGSRDAWDWCGWLPHGRDPGAGSLLAGDHHTAESLAAELIAGSEEGPLRLVVIDDHGGMEARRGPARSILRHTTEASRLVPVVLVPDLRSVPASAGVVLAVSSDGTLQASPDMADGPAAVLGTSEGTARDVARVLAGFDDPEVDDPGRDLPRSVGLAGMLGADRMLGPVVAARWRAATADPAPRALLGQGPDGPVEVDLAADGPHALIAGTTGAGKSELLRTLVASLALGSSPDHLAFVLIDFKGGSAFDACAHLPHVTGVVTDLDDHLAARALRCLEAELHHREGVLRAVGADDLAAYRRLGSGQGPLPRLVVVIDEFATLAAELPDFVDALVGVAQRGRSLGVHLVLATQRPAGAVSDKIRANTALRVALRVQDRADSSDVIDVPDAADLPRQLPGRALVRFGPGELVTVQTALATARTCIATAPVTVAPIGLAIGPPVTGGRTGEQMGAGDGEGTGPTDLERLVAATTEAWRDLHGAPPRPVWPEPLPTDLAWPLRSCPIESSAPTSDPGLVLGLADDPDRQRQIPFTWTPDAGSLLVAGGPGSGASTALSTAVLAVAFTWPATEAHVHVIDMGAGGLGPLQDLDAVGHVVGSDDGERQRRLIEDLADLLAARRSTAGDGWGGPRRFLVVDGVGALRARWDPLEPTGTWDRFTDVVTRGAPFGIHVAMAVEGPGAAPQGLISACGQRLVLRLGDRTDHSAFGVSPASVPALPAGRGQSAADGLVVQVARPPRGTTAAVAALADTAPAVPDEHLPRSVDVLPETLTVTQLTDRAGSVVEVGGDGSLHLAVGIAESRLATARLTLAPGGHALVAGAPRSGRSTILDVLAGSIEEVGIPVLRLDRSNRSEADVRAALDASGPLVVTIDDADQTADDDPLLARLAAERRPDRHLMVAARTDRLRSRYAHWTREVRVDRCGLLLAPDPDLDGELLGTRLPRAWPVAPRPGLAWLVGGEPEGTVQLAGPESAPQGAGHVRSSDPPFTL